MVHTTGTSLSAVPDLFAPSRMQAGHGPIAFSPGSAGSSVDFLNSLESALRFEQRSQPSHDTPHDVVENRRRQDTSREHDISREQDTSRERIRSDETRSDEARRASARDDAARDAASKRIDEVDRTESQRTEQTPTDETTSSGEEGATQQRAEPTARDSANGKRSNEDDEPNPTNSKESAGVAEGHDLAVASGRRSPAGEITEREPDTEAQDADAVEGRAANALGSAVLRKSADAATAQEAAIDGASEGGDKESLAAAMGGVNKEASEDADTEKNGPTSAGRRVANSVAGNGETDSASEQERGDDRVAVLGRSRTAQFGDDASEDDPSEGRERRGADSAEGSRRVRLDVRDLRADATREPRAEGKSTEGGGAKIDLDSTVAGRRSEGADGPARGAGGERPDVTPGRALREQLQPELVRHARLVVRGESSGDIRLTLRPEQLGRVRISLHLEDNRIAGRIIVENGSVRDAFQANVQALERALRDAGLETAGLEVTVGEGDSHDEAPQHHGHRRRIAKGFEEMIPQLTGWYDDSSRVSLYA